MKGSRKTKASERKTKQKVDEKKDVCSAKIKKVEGKAAFMLEQITDQYIRFLIMRYIVLKRHLFKNQVLEPVPLINPVDDVLEETMIVKVLQNEEFTDQDIQIDASVFCSSDEEGDNTGNGLKFSKDFFQTIENIKDLQNKNFDYTNIKSNSEDIRVCVSSTNTYLDYIPLSKLFQGAVNKKHCKKPEINYNSNETAANKEDCRDSKLQLRGRLLVPLRPQFKDNETKVIRSEVSHQTDSSTDSSENDGSSDEEFLPTKRHEEHSRKKSSKTFACSICKFNVETIGYDKHHLVNCYKRYCLNNRSNNK